MGEYQYEDYFTIEKACNHCLFNNNIWLYNEE